MSQCLGVSVTSYDLIICVMSALTRPLLIGGAYDIRSN
jgi:hypothetical protein